MSASFDEDLEGAHVLCVDDDPAILRALQSVLSSHGISVNTLDQAVGLVEAAARIQPDLILLDVEMPGMDGLTACRMLRADDRTRALPVVIVTGRSEPADHVAGLAAGADDCLAKPVHEPLLLARIRSSIRRHRAERRSTQLIAELERVTGRDYSETIRRRGVEQVVGTLLFVDVRSLSATAQQEDAQRVYAALDALLSVASERCVTHDGVVERLSAEGVLGVFSGPDAVVRATKAAAGIVRWARDAPTLAFWNPPPVAIGIHHGTCLRAVVGRDGRRERMVFGIAAQVAARLSGAAQELEVLLSEAAWSHVAGVVDLAEPREASIKGARSRSRVWPLIVS